MREDRFIVDGMNLVRRAFHTTGGFATKSGYPTGILYTVIRVVHALLREGKDVCDVIFCWEGMEGRAWRKAIYPQYKANRKPDSDSDRELFNTQIQDVEVFLQCCGITQIRARTMEADDVIGLLCTCYTSDDIHDHIVSTDKDFLQLLNHKTSMGTESPSQSNKYYTTNIKGEVICGADEIAPSPEAAFMRRVLMGDTSDGIKGVGGLGVMRSHAVVNSAPRSNEDIVAYLTRRRDEEKTFNSRTVCAWCDKALANLPILVRNTKLMRLGNRVCPESRDAYQCGARLIKRRLSAYAQLGNAGDGINGATYAPFAYVHINNVGVHPMWRFFSRREFASFGKNDLLDLSRHLRVMHANRFQRFEQLSKQAPGYILPQGSAGDAVAMREALLEKIKAPTLKEVGALTLPRGVA